MSVETISLANGLRVLSARMAAVETVSLGVWVNVGTRHETAEVNGIAHMLEHMAFKGTRQRSARAIAEETIQAYLSGEIDAVYIVYNEFKNAVTQEIRVERLLPVVAEEVADTSEPGVEFVYEPGKQELQDTIAPLHIAVQIHRTILESIASEMGARMTAMDGATKNAGELNDRLKLLYNRARQASITKELMEIVGGSEALKG